MSVLDPKADAAALEPVVEMAISKLSKELTDNIISALCENLREQMERFVTELAEKLAK